MNDLVYRLDPGRADADALDYLRRVGATVRTLSMPGRVLPNELGPGMIRDLGVILKRDDGALIVYTPDPTNLDELAILATALLVAERMKWTGAAYFVRRVGSQSSLGFVEAIVSRPVTDDDMDAQLRAVLETPQAGACYQRSATVTDRPAGHARGVEA